MEGHAAQAPLDGVQPQPVLIGRDYALGRNLIGFWPFGAALVAVGVASTPRRLAALPALAIGVPVALATGALVVDGSLQRPDWDGLAAAIGPPRPGQAIVASGGSSALPLGHYIGSGGVPPNIVIKATEVIAVGPEAPHGRRNCENGPLCNIGTAHPLAATIPGLRLVERRDTGRWHLARYRAAKPVTLDPAVADRFFDVPRLPQRFRHGAPARAR